MTWPPRSPVGMPPGWYPDPGGAPGVRWWNGTYWGAEFRPLSPPPPSSPPLPGRPPDSNQAAMWAHLAPLCTVVAAFIIPLLAVCYWVGPLVIRNSFRKDRFVHHHATEALNETLTGIFLFVCECVAIVIAILLIIHVHGYVLADVAVGVLLVAAGLLLFVHGVIRITYEIIAAIRAYHGEYFLLPWWVAYRFLHSEAPAERDRVVAV